MIVGFVLYAGLVLLHQFVLCISV